MTHESARDVNAGIWEALYASGRNDLRYPSEVLVRLAARLLPAGLRLRVLDFGFGTGANLAHLAGMGHELHGVEVAASALVRTRERLDAMGLAADLRLVGAGSALPFGTRFFDAVVAWQVLCYNDLQGWADAVRELERVTRAGGTVLVATPAPGDVSQRLAQPLGGAIYRSLVPGQEGCLLTIPDREQLDELFPGRRLEVGEFAYSFGGLQARHWIVSYRMEEP